jgi:hypothetical protein
VIRLLENLAHEKVWVQPIVVVVVVGVPQWPHGGAISDNYTCRANCS